jgi:hypothetical protein
MSQGSYKVFAFDGLRGDGTTTTSSRPGVLGAESVIRVRPGTVVYLNDATVGGEVALEVGVPISARVIITIPITATDGVIRTSEDTTISLLEPLPVMSTPLDHQTVGAGVQLRLPKESLIEVVAVPQVRYEREYKSWLGIGALVVVGVTCVWYAIFGGKKR